MDEGEDVADRASLSGTATLNISLPVRRRGLLISAGLVAGALALPGAAGAWELADPVRGASGTPDYALPPYDPTGAGIPADAIDAGGFDGPAAWLDALEREGRPGRIGSGTYDLSGVGLRVLTQSIFGYDTGGGRPVLVGGDGAAFYLHADGRQFQYLHWRDWACPLIRTSTWEYDSLQFSSSRTNFGYFDHSEVPSLDADLEGVAILDSVFERCDTGFAFLSDQYRIAGVHVARNLVHGGKGFIYLMCHVHDDVRLYQNVIRGMRQGTSKGNHVGTIFMVGYNDSQPRGRCGPVHTEFNECVDVQSEHSHDKINGSVFADVRQATGWFCRGNVIRNCRNSVGHVDCNALYGKSYDILVENNLFEDNGANAVDGKAGSEGAQITFKGGDPDGNNYGLTMIRRNLFRCGTVNTVSAILTSNETVITDNVFENYWMAVPEYSHGTGLIRTYSGGPIRVGPNGFVNCGVIGGDRYCYLVSANNNVRAHDLVVDYDGNATEVFLDVAEIENCTNTRGEPLVNAR